MRLGTPRRSETTPPPGASEGCPGAQRATPSPKGLKTPQVRWRPLPPFKRLSHSQTLDIDARARARVLLTVGGRAEHQIRGGSDLPFEQYARASVRGHARKCPPPPPPTAQQPWWLKGGFSAVGMQRCPLSMQAGP